jgi:hypothetical protein
MQCSGTRQQQQQQQQQARNTSSRFGHKCLHQHVYTYLGFGAKASTTLAPLSDMTAKVWESFKRTFQETIVLQTLAQCLSCATPLSEHFNTFWHLRSRAPHVSKVHRHCPVPPDIWRAAVA